MPVLARDRFHSLDFLRGLAAISIIFWHWKHFFFTGTDATPAVHHTVPLYSFFALFYDKGRLAVELFYSLSGFIFFWLYAEKITERKTNGWSFFVFRFSRLYPLHFVCICLTLLLQWMYFSSNGMFFVYSYNDLYHTFLNLLFIQSWGLEKGYSLDGPTWSVSIEVLVYVLFFILASRHLLRYTWLVAVIAVLSLYIKWIPVPIQMGIFCFLTGGVVYRIYRDINAKMNSFLMVCFSLLTSVAWLIALEGMNTAPLEVVANTIPFSSKVIHLVIYLFPQTILFPLTILTLALSETWLHVFWKKIGSIGDITYSTYLLHFPLQLAVVLVLPYLGIDSDFFEGPFSLVLFLLLLASIAFISFHKFELPVQRFLRKKLLKQPLPVN
jgi:peptidoglycan/LPS O-acetylase OafA/YrhL